ncbi:SIR2 family NAD-dependent protein deacylase [Gemmata sp.]|uniref:SIR2 family NAD-dependent protein deacylase n=1 Tax=Gemmata sp. TaxID=1914242 RepID=UPI003F7167A7
MPTWEELTTALIDRLYPDGSGGERRREWLSRVAGATSVANRLAEEYTVAFGRHDLDNLIKETVPDADFGPGPLHRCLLELPWADVLTTNYDTLLEREAATVFRRRYTVVRRPEEISSAARPRIVKLHGSFPSNSPFILTEDDFRTYPRRYAPFVNLVRQAVMENSLCLIGFSGDDPNFLAWSGWVRDELAEYAPRIYLCGLLDLSTSQRSLLQARGVIPVDLSPLFPSTGFPNAAHRHTLALQWLLNSLQAHRSSHPLDWPKAPPPQPPDDPEMPRLPPSPIPTPVSEPEFPNQDGEGLDGAKTILSAARAWTHNRSLYPGWLIAPDEVRDRVWRTTKHWIAHYVEARPGIYPVQQLEVLDELNWRLELALSPVWNELRPELERALSAVNPFPTELKDLPTTAVTPGSTKELKSNWREVRRQWQTLAFALVRFYREERLDEPFETWHGRMDRLPLDADARARLCYERCLYAVARLDDEQATESVSRWPEDTQDPFWSVRKAGILAELGRVDEAIDLAQTAVDVLRRGILDTADHIFALSREGWAVWLLNGIDQSERRRRRAPRDLERSNLVERFRQLRRFGADPWDLADWFTTRLGGEPPQPTAPSETRLGFEPGTATHTTRSSEDFHDRLLTVYQLLRFTEESGIPPVVPSVYFSKDAHVTAATWFADHDPSRTQSLMFRLRAENILDSYLSRSRIAALPQPLVDRWRTDALRAAEASVPCAGAGRRDAPPVERRAADRLTAATTILARLIVRAPENERQRLWEFARSLAPIPAVRGHVTNPQAVRALFHALAANASVEEIEAQLPALFNIPLPGEPDFHVFHPDNWPDPPLVVGDRARRRSSGLRTGQLTSARRRAVTALKSEGTQLRRAAMWRCDLLHDLGATSAADERAMAVAFWGPVLKKSGLPWELWGPYTGKLALSIPVPSGRSAAVRVKEDILAKQLGAVLGGFVQPDSYFRLIRYATAPRTTPHDTRREYIEWTAEDHESLFKKLRAWWNDHGREAVTSRRERRLFEDWDRDALALFMRGLWDVVRDVLLPHVRRRSRLASEILSFVEEVRDCGLPVGSVLPATLLVRPLSELNVVVSDLRREFAHTGVEFYLSALRGLNHWAELSRSDRGRSTTLPAIPPDLLREIGATVATRRPGALRLALQASVHILGQLQVAADRQFRNSLLVGLDYLFSELAYSERASSQRGIKYEEIPSTRYEVVRLAKALSDLGDAGDRVVQAWLEAARSDPLPEIRRAAGTISDSEED